MIGSARRVSLCLATAAVLLTAPGCAIVSDSQTVEDLKAGADMHTTFRVTTSPPAACSKVARMLMWCAGGPNYHYRCNISSDGNRAELSGTLEAVYRTEFFMVTEFVRRGGDTEATVHQLDSLLVYDYAPMIEKYLAGTLDCRPR